jgi:hypothetical protein
MVVVAVGCPGDERTGYPVEFLWRRAAAALFAVLLTLTNTAIASANLPTVDVGLAEKLEDELRFRRDFGLSTDLGLVRALMADPTAYDGGYGVALMPAELADLQRRLAIEEQMNPLEEHAQAQPSFAGLWIDQRAGGVITVAFAGDATTQRTEIEALAPSGSTVQVIDVEYTLAELEATLELVEAQRLELKDRGLWIRELGIDPRPNRVEVAVEELTDSAVAELHARFGDAIVVEQSGNPTPTGCTDRYHCIGPPVRAGLAAPTNSSYPCSLGFLVKQSGAPGTGWLTAGHCAPTLGSVWHHDGVSIGAIRATCWPNCMRSDSAVGGWLNATYSSYRVYRTPTSNTQVGIVQVQNGDNIGDQVCLNARREPFDTGFRCGFLDEKRRVDYGNVYFVDMRYATFSAWSGDSGGAVHSPLTNSRVNAYGIQSGCENRDGSSDGCQPGQNDGRGIYSHIYWVTRELGGIQGLPPLTVCSVSTPCP